MLFRAIFWVGLVWVLMPHEPDIGLGRPNSTAQFARNLPGWFHLGSAPTADGSPALRGLAQVKAEIAAARKHDL